jgi:hypothetical protein
LINTSIVCSKAVVSDKELTPEEAFFLLETKKKIKPPYKTIQMISNEELQSIIKTIKNPMFKNKRIMNKVFFFISQNYKQYSKFGILQLSNKIGYVIITINAILTILRFITN